MLAQSDHSTPWETTSMDLWIPWQSRLVFESLQQKNNNKKTRCIMNHFTASQHWYSWWAKWGLQKPTPVRLSHAASVFHLLWLRAGRLPLFLRRQVLRLYCCWFLKPGAVLWPWGTNRRWGLKLPWEWFWPWRPQPWLCLKPNLFSSSGPWELDLKV